MLGNHVIRRIDVIFVNRYLCVGVNDWPDESANIASNVKLF